METITSLSDNFKSYHKKNDRYFFTITCLVIIFIACLIYFQSLNNPFTNFDDTDYITSNKDIRTLNSDSIGYTLKNTFSTYVMGNYHPITILSYCIEYNLFKLEPKGYHVNNLIIHILNSLLVYLFIWLLIKEKWSAFITALLFSIHPMHVESVVWVSERKDLLYSFFLLISLCCYIKYLDSKNKVFYYLTLLAFILSVFSKAMGVCIPILLILIDFLKNKKISRILIIEKTPFIIISFILGIVAILAQKSFNSIHISTTYSILEKAMFSSYGILTYLVKLIFPFDLRCFYSYPINYNGTYPFIFYIAPFIILIICFLIFKSLKFNNIIFFGFTFFIVTIILVLQILPVGGAIIAERYTYIPYIGIFFIIGNFINKIIEDEIKNLISIKVPILLGICLICVTYSILSYRQTKNWTSSINLWENVIKKNTFSPDWVKTNLRISYIEQADKYFKIGKYSSAISLFTIYINSKNDNAVVYFKRGFCFYKLNQPSKAIDDFDLAIKYSPRYLEAYFNRGIVFLEKGSFEKAINDFSSAIKIKPDYYEAYYNRGAAFSDLKKYNEAIKDYTYVLTYLNNDPKTLYNRSGAYYLSQQYDLALLDAMKAKKAGYPIDQEYINALKKLQ